MQKYYTQQESKELDRMAVEEGHSIRHLIEVAGFAAFEVVDHIIGSKQSKIGVYVGPGNNGADGLVVARYLIYKGHEVTILINRTNHNDILEICLRNKVELIHIKDDGTLNGNEEIQNHSDIIKFDFVIDAIFGFSFVGAIRKPYDLCIESFRLSNSVICIDIPSGYIVDSEENEGLFVPKAVVALSAPKICCKPLNCYLARAFLKGGWNNFSGFLKLKK